MPLKRKNKQALGENFETVVETNTPADVGNAFGDLEKAPKDTDMTMTAADKKSVKTKGARAKASPAKRSAKKTTVRAQKTRLKSR